MADQGAEKGKGIGWVVTKKQGRQRRRATLQLRSGGRDVA